MADKFNLKQKKELIFICAVFLIVLFFGKKIWDRQKANLLAVKDKIKDYQEKVNLFDQINKFTADVKKFNGLSWDTIESVSVMGNINELASKYNIEIFNFDPGNTKNEKHYSTLTMSLNIRASYSNLVRFLSSIEELPTLTKIINLRIVPAGPSGPEEEGGPKIQANLAVRAFVLER